MRIFTDGEIVNESSQTTQNIEQFYIGNKEYKHKVDTLKIKNMYFKNYSYVIVYLIAKENMIVGNVGGWFDVIKDVSIYLQNSKDKKAIKNAKEAIRAIEKLRENVDYSSVWGMLFSSTRGNELEKFETEEISKNVYCLKKVRK